MNFWHSLGGVVLVDLTSADISGLLHALEVQNIPIYDALFIDQMRIQFSLKRKDLSRLQSFVEKRGAYIHILEERGLHTYWGRYKKRPVLILGILVIALISMWLPSRVFFVQIEGNQNLPAALIKEYAENCGIGFGASRKAVRSEKMKNELLELFEFAGVDEVLIGPFGFISQGRAVEFHFGDQNFGFFQFFVLESLVSFTQTFAAPGHTQLFNQSFSFSQTGRDDLPFDFRGLQLQFVEHLFSFIDGSFELPLFEELESFFHLRILGGIHLLKIMTVFVLHIDAEV